MAESEDKKKRPLRLFYRIGLEILIFAALAAATALALYPLQKLMRGRMEELRDTLLNRAEQFSGRKIEYASIGPSIFGTLDIRNIRILRSDTSPVLTISRLRLSYSFWRLVRGGVAESLRSIRIDRPLLNFNAEIDGDLLGMFPASSKRAPGEVIRLIGGFLPDKVQVSVRNGTGNVALAGLRIHADGVGFDASLRDGRIGFQGKWNAGLSLPPLAGIVEARLSGRANGECASDFSNGSANLALTSVRGDLFRVRPLTVKLSLTGNNLEIRKINDRVPFDISLDYDLYSRQLTGGFRCENFLLRDILSLHGLWQSYDHWLATKVSGRVAMEKEGEDVLYTIDISGAGDAGPVGGASFVIDGRGNRSRINFDRFSLNLPEGDLSFRGWAGFSPFSPNGYLLVSNLSITGAETFNAGFNISTRGREISVFGENAALGSVLLSALDLSVIPESRGISFELSALRFRNLESYETVRLSRLSLEGSFDYDPRNVQASFLLEAFSLRDLVEMARPFVNLPNLLPPVLAAVDGISLTTEVFITTDFEHLLYNAPRFVIAYEGGGRDLIALVSLSGTDRRFELLSSRISWGGGGAEFSGYTDFSNVNEISFSLISSYLDFFYELEGKILDRRFVNVRGSYGLQIFIDAAGPGIYSGYATVHEILLPYRGGVARCSFYSSLYYEPGRFWSLDINSFELADIATPGSSLAVLRFSGEANRNGAVLEDIYFDDGRGILRGRLTFNRKEGGAGFDGSLVLDNAVRKEHCDLEASYDSTGTRLTLRLLGSNIQLGRVLRNAYQADASGELRLVWDSPDLFSADLQLESLNARVQDGDLRLSASATLDAGEFLLRNLQAHYDGIEAAVPLLRLDRSEGRADTEVRIRGTSADQDFELGFIASVEFQPLDSWFKLSRLADSVSGSLMVSDVRFGSIRAEPFGFSFSRFGPRVAFSGGPRDMIRFKLAEGGDFYLGLSNPSPIRGSVIGILGPQTIEAQTQDLYIDLASLWRFIPAKAQENVTLTGGYATASLRVAGSLGDPEFFGVVQGNSLRLRVPDYVSQDIRPIPLTVTLEGNEAVFGPVTAAVGSGGGEVSGWFRFERWIPNTFAIDIHVPPETPVPIGVDIKGLVAGGAGSGDLLVALSDMVLTVSGDLTAQETEISLNTDELLGQTDVYRPQKKVSVAVELIVRTGRRVEFLWPNTSIPILQAYAAQGSALKISSDTLSRRYSLEGDVRLRGGEIFYVERSFYIREGALSFKENEIRFDPRISARAEIRDRSNSGPVTISMIIDNAPLKSFTARFESNPPLSQIEIFSLLGQSLTGVPSEGENGLVRRSFVASSFDLLTQFAVVRRIERQVRGFFGLDMFSVRTQLLQNAVLQVAGLQDPVDRIDGVGNYFDNTTVFLGKYFGPDMFTQFMISLRYDEKKAALGGLTLEPDMGIELHGPLFDIRWNFVPLHPENMYINDQSFTLTWRWSF